MILKVLGSSSKGNCYLLQAASGQTLIIEAGVKVAELKQALDWKLSNVVGCLVTHRHMDHAKYAADYMACGIKVLTTQDVLDTLKDNKYSHFGKLIVPMHGYKIGEFKVFVLPVCHDVPCVGFIIEHAGMGKLLFITDTMMFEYAMPKGVEHLLIEANYADDILQENIDNGIMPVAMRDRLLHSHMELRTTKNVILSNDISSVINIVLLHLSDRNSDAKRFQSEIRQASQRFVYVAHKGMELFLGHNPY